MKRPEWSWVSEDVVWAIHDEQVAEHGGLGGIRDMALVRSALARPQNLSAYEVPDAADLAAAYAYGLARNHGFSDGNKRTAYVVALVFLLDNGYEFVGTDVESVGMMVRVAAGEVGERQLAAWFRGAIRPASDDAGIP